MPYQPIQTYGVIGDMHTAALVGMDGSIDWFCFPHFDSPSIFAALLDAAKGGRFKIAPERQDITRKQFYWPDTNVLVTRFLSPDGVGDVIDFMPVGAPANGHGYHQIIRRVLAIRGTMTFQLGCFPAFNYARDAHSTTIHATGASFAAPRLHLGLTTTVPLEPCDRGVVAQFTLHEGETAAFVLHAIDEAAPVSIDEVEDRFEETVAYWRHWLAQCTYRGRWQEMVHRSALVLKLLTFAPTGAIIAAPTASLPETVGGVRNWDYRYTWLRDAAFTLYGFLRIGFTNEAAQFMHWLAARCFELKPNGPLQVMYGIDGRQTLTEEILDHLDGYRSSRPVRVGNGAYTQLQLDIYGELLDAVYLYNKYGAPISYALWTRLRTLLNWVCDNWRRPDEGIWEVRSGQQHFVYSKLMCWVALDRGIRLADKRSFPADRDHWLKVRDQIYEDIMINGWSDERKAFIQAYGSDTLDAANLIMPLVFFLAPNDPRMLQTLDAVNRSPRQGGLVSNSLVYRLMLRSQWTGWTAWKARSICAHSG